MQFHTVIIMISVLLQMSCTMCMYIYIYQTCVLLCAAIIDNNTRWNHLFKKTFLVTSYDNKITIKKLALIFENVVVSKRQNYESYSVTCK